MTTFEENISRRKSIHYTLISNSEKTEWEDGLSGFHKPTSIHSTHMVTRT
jgi:hypothetical protein